MQNERFDTDELIIDSHAHIGSYGEWDCPPEKLLQMMQEHGIKHAFVSDMDANDYGAVKTEASLAKIQPYKDTLRLLIFIHPGVEGDYEITKKILEQRRDVIYGLKFHPTTARVTADDARCDRYAKLCEQYQLPMDVHTENNHYAEIAALARLAKRHPYVNFIAVHMELCTNHLNAFPYIRDIPNLYGDTTLVDSQSAVKAIEECGADKILFGSDAPALTTCYQTLEEIKHLLPERYGQKVYEKVMYQNCKRLFHLSE